MIRKFNYTGRKKIKRNHIQIDILRDSDDHRLFNASLHLSDMELPANAHVYVEAYHRTAYQRFSFGTAGDRKVPGIVTLARVKVAKSPGVPGLRGSSATTRAFQL